MKAFMNMPMIAHMNMGRWNGLSVGIIVAVMVHLTVTAANFASRLDEPWPLLLSDEPGQVDPGIALLRERANGSLERLVQSSRAPEQPL